MRPPTSSRMSSSTETQVGSVFGTPAYMSPEQASGEAYDARSEVFSLGAVFWELLTLQPLVDPDLEPVAAVARARHRNVPWATGVAAHRSQGPVPANLSWFISRATARDPADRFQSVGEMMQVLEQTVAGQFTPKCLYSLHQRMLAEASTWHDRHPALFPFVAIGSVVSLVLLGVAIGILAV